MRAALFDLDETILDRSRSLRDFACWQAAELVSVDDQARFVERFIELDQDGRVWKDVVYASLTTEFEIAAHSADELLEIYLTQFCRFCLPRDGALKVVSAFHELGYKIGLVSNGKTPFQERNFAALEFNTLFDCVVVSEAVGLRKPDKAIYELACRNLSVDINASVFIGDNPIADVKGAKEAGMDTIFVPVDAQHPHCEYADFTSHHLHEVADYIRRRF